MTEIEKIATLMCQRRGKALIKIESVAMSMRIVFGLADLTFLLPAVANTFYYVKSLGFVIVVQIVTSRPIIRLTNYGGGSAGALDWKMPTEWVAGQPSNGMFGSPFETDSMQFLINGWTAGEFIILGEIFKITHTA